MGPRERWQALQQHLADAHRLLAAGDRAGALAEVDTALQLDPDFLAAHSLRDRIENTVPDVPRPPAPAASPDAGGRAAQDMRDGFAAFEDRVRWRRAERCAAAARRALAERRLRDAAAAIDEIRELKPELPQLADLEAMFEVAISAPRRRTAPGRWLMAGAAFASIVFAATMLERSGLDSRALLGYPMFPDRLAVAPTDGGGDLPPAPEDADRIEMAIERPVATVLEPARTPQPAISTPAESLRPVPTATLGTLVTTPPRPVPPPAAAPTAAPPPPSAPAVEPPARTVADAALVNTPSAVMPPPADDERLIRGALQEYRTAYEGLDARSARAVWPAVDEQALARAFDGLESQSLMFDNCDVQLRGAAASAVCRGRMQYVAKVGSRDPRVEPRVWTFTLRKSGEAWQIASARVER